MQEVDLLLLEDLMLRPKPGATSRGRALETALITTVLLCLIGILFQATWVGTTVVVASPPEIGDTNARGGEASQAP